MNILVVGNITKDVYLNLDSRTEHFETDKHGTKWLDLAFNASEHRFFNRNSSLGGAAVTLETLQKLGLNASVSDSALNFNSTTDSDTAQPSDTYRYILIADDDVTYLAPSKFTHTTFTPPSTPVDYLYLDRSAELTASTAKQITSYLNNSPDAKLITYVRNFNNHHLNQLLPQSELIFAETNDAPELQHLDPAKIIHLSENQLEYANITEPISIHRIDMFTHLSLYSIAAATILGSFILGYSVEDSLKLARLNLENSKLNSVLTLSTLQELASVTTHQDDIELIAKNLVLSPKGILAADESGGSIHKKFDQLNIEDTYDNRRDYRNLFFTTPDLAKYVNGVILFDETARQLADNGQNFVDFLTARRIIPGIKVDQGLEKFANSEETYTKGLDDLEQRLKEYYQMGLRFAKWRAAFEIRLDKNGNLLTPTDHAISENCRILAEYAKNCQKAGLVPIVEPELVYDGNYNIDQSASVTAQILDTLFTALESQKVNLRACILKVNMVLAGKQQDHQSTPDEIGAKTSEVLKGHVPTELAGVVFLSGGQTPEQATDNLAAIIKHGPYPWPVTFSFARALQDPALFAWAGDNANAEKARQAFADRLIANTKIL
ncbi:fructose-bisphosphate aldolase class I [Candidatus Saccharibacteria bacterium]|nr:fructose-bisphosphate aldolase class I [Candidatus Saccharibacteria bacterium]